MNKDTMKKLNRYGMPGMFPRIGVKEFIVLSVICGMIVITGAIVALTPAKAADITYSVINNATKQLLDMGDGTYAEVTTGRVQNTVYMAEAGIGADAYRLLIDLSDTTNYPHTATDEVVVTGYDWTWSLDGAALWTVCIGVITAIDDTDSTVILLRKPFPDITATFTVQDSYTFAGSGVPTSLMFAADTTISAVTTGTDLQSPAGTTQAEVGDILMIFDEVTGTQAVSFSITMSYWTR